MVTPNANTTYTATATGPGGTATAAAAVTVALNPPNINAINHIIYMLQENRSFDHYFGKLNEYRVANHFGGATDVDGIPATSQNPADAHAILSWSSTNATSVNIDNGVGTMLPTSGSQTVAPSTTTKYTATASGTVSSAQASVVVGVMPSGGSFQVGASPLSIASGETALLSWSFPGAVSVTISCAPAQSCPPQPPPPPPFQPPGPYGPTALTPVKPTVTTVYTIAASPASAGSATVTVTVGPRPAGAPTIHFSVEQQLVSTGALLTQQVFKLTTTCVEDFSPDWLESHGAFNKDDPGSNTPLMDGFVHIAAGFAQFANSSGDIFHHYFDERGTRAMGYYDQTELPYYYFMASQFATSDRFFSPVPSNSPPNRLYALAATSHGLAHGKVAGQERGLDSSISPPIFQQLQNAGVSWKVYYTDINPGTGKGNSTLNGFQPFATSAADAAHFAPVDCNRKDASGVLLTPCVAGQTDYLTDVRTGNLPSVVYVEPGFNSGLDEHPGNNVQPGAAYVASLINSLMSSPSWKDSVFILSFDEAGGLFDHVVPAATVNPDGVKPSPFCGNVNNCPYSDLEIPGKDAFSLCDPANPSSGVCVEFTRTGFRVPMIVVSPFAKKNYVSHTVADFTAILKLVETRFKVPSLTKRDAAQPDMTDFFDFVNAPWRVPPVPPAQPISNACNFQTLP